MQVTKKTVLDLAEHICAVGVWFQVPLQVVLVKVARPEAGYLTILIVLLFYPETILILLLRWEP